MSIAELRKLPSKEKLKIIEALWGDLAGDEDAFESPAWHEEELKKTETDFAAGRTEALDWEEAKKELRTRFEKLSPPAGAPLPIRYLLSILKDEAVVFRVLDCRRAPRWIRKSLKETGEPEH